MNSTEKKLSGLNLWFIIEILSFYGYILSAMLFMLEHTVKSSFGWINKQSLYNKKAKEFDFLAYYKKDCDWYAFITILLTVNSVLMWMDVTVLQTEREKYN